MPRLSILSGFGPRAEEALITNYATLSPQQIFQFTISILQKPSAFRDSLDEKFLTKTFNNLSFFQTVVQEHGPEAMKNCCKYLGYETLPPNSCVFRQESNGDKFYVIIRGKVQVQIDEFHNNKFITKTVGELGVGSSFGELALITDLPRNATIICSEECHFGILTKEHYNLILADSTKRRVEAKAQDISTFYIFRNTDRHFLLQLIYHFDCEEVGLNRVLFKEGEPAKDIYFIMSGKVKLLTTLHILQEDGFEVPEQKPTTRTSKKIGNRAAEIVIFGKGEILGLEDVMENRPRKTTAICVEPGTIYKISAVEFRKRVLGALSDSYIKDCKGYVRNREKWFETRIEKVREQMIRSPEFFISLPQTTKKEPKSANTPAGGLKRTNTLDTENFDPRTPREMPRTSSAAMMESLPQASPRGSDRGIGFYLTSLQDDDNNNKDAIDMFITEPPRKLEKLRKNKEVMSRYTSKKNLDLSLDKIRTPIDLTPERIDTGTRKRIGGDTRKMLKLFECGIFEKNFDEDSEQRRDGNQSLFLPEIRHGSPVAVERERSQNFVREKQRAIPNANSYFAEKERLLERLEKKSCQTWDLQNHLVKMMQDKSELNRRINMQKRNNIHMDKKPSILKPVITQRKQSLPLITETEKVTDHPCVVVHVPKKYSSVREDNKGIRLVSRSYIQSPTHEDEYRGSAQKGFVSNIAEFQEKVNGWKGPYAMLNKRLKRKFVRSQFENLHIGVEYT